MFLRSPLKLLLTFILMVAASYVLVSRVTDYVIVSREEANARSFYHGVAALDNSVSDITFESNDNGLISSYSIGQKNKEWPTDKEIKEFTSLPGVTLTDNRYMTAGLVENYKRLVDKGYGDYNLGHFAVEGTYSGYDTLDGSSEVEVINILLDDITILAGDIEPDKGKTLKIETIVKKEMQEEESQEKEQSEENYLDDFEYPLSYFDELKKGTGCLVMGTYNEENGSCLRMYPQTAEEKLFYSLANQGKEYIDSEEFTYAKGYIGAAKQDIYTYDIVYTSDMRAIPCFNDRTMVITKGHILTGQDKNRCVVNELFLKKNNLSIGDKIKVRLGDKLCSQNAVAGARSYNGEDIAKFSDAVELEITGAYQFSDDVAMRVADNIWSYTPSTIFVPSELLSIDVPSDYEPSPGEFSVYIESTDYIEEFKSAAEPLAAKMGLALHFSDGGWMSVKDSYETGSQALFITTLLFVLAVGLALVLALFLYIAGNKKSYAIMRILGVPDREAENSIRLPIICLSVLAIPSGGIAGLIYTFPKAAKVLEDMAANAPDSYVLNKSLPVDAVIICLISELLFVMFTIFIYIKKLKLQPPLGLLHEGIFHRKSRTDVRSNPAEDCRDTISLDISKLYDAEDEKNISGKKYGAIRHVGKYILRHMCRSFGKTIISLCLVAVITAGIGVFVLMRLSYHEAFNNIEVKGRAVEFSSSSVFELSKSDMFEELYYYSDFNVRAGDRGVVSSVIVTNNCDKYFNHDYNIQYADGYDGSALNGTGQVCMLGRALADDLNVSPGDEITIINDGLYTFLQDLYKNNENFNMAAINAGHNYKVIGIIDSGDEKVCNGIMAAPNSAAEELYGQPFSVRYCEFVLANNAQLDAANEFLEGQKKAGMEYARMASYYIDSAGLENIGQIRDLLDSLFPVAVAATMLIGLIVPGMVIIQSSRDAACLRILGVTGRRTRCMLIFEQIIICIIGIVIVAGVIGLSGADLFRKSIETLTLCWTGYLCCSICSVIAASVLVTCHNMLFFVNEKG